MVDIEEKIQALGPHLVSIWENREQGKSCVALEET